ncbi:MAG: hypothetical protein ACRDJ9_36590 [Dehalococcoidia bacterium]
MTRRDLDSALLQLGRRQYGAFGHGQARSLGFTDRLLQTRRLAGSHVRLAPNVSAIVSFPPTWQRQYKAAELTVREAALCGLAACKVHDLDGARVVKPEIVVPYTRSARNHLARVHRSEATLVTARDGFSVTTVAQTLFDVMNRMTVGELERAMDGAVLGGQVDVGQLNERLRAYEASRRPNLALWRALTQERSEEGWEPAESELEVLLWQAYQLVPAAPPASRQACATWWKAGRGRFDVWIDDWRLILEADGRRWHGRVRDFDEDRWRDNIAVAHGYRVQRFTYTHLTCRQPEVVELLRRAGMTSAAA